VSDHSALAHLAAAGAAMTAGMVNAIAGGGTLISFPVLTALGVPAVRANATSSIALLPGYFGGVAAQRKDLTGLGPSLRPRLIAGALGGLCGAILLIVTSEAAFKQVVPFLILLACLLLGSQDRLRKWLFAESHQDHQTAQVMTIFVAAIYGGYFGAGLGIMYLAILGLFSSLPLNRLNAVKQSLSVVTSTSSVAFLMFTGRAEWTLVAVMAPASLIGGNIGGRLASRLPPKRLRLAVIAFGVVAALIYLSRL
jgi:uncharacterized protein